MNEELTREELELAEAGEEMLDAEGATLGGIYRDIDTITAEISFFKRQAADSICEIGLRLIEAKTQLRHGEWLPWLRNEVEFSEASAQRYMQLAREYGKSITVRDLGVSKALQLLALPASEREEFIAETHEVNGEEKSVSEMTRKELEQAIRERDAARRELMDTKDELAETSELLDKKTDEYAALSAVARKLQGNVEEAEKRIDELKNRPVDIAVQERDASPEQIEAAKAEARAEAEKKHAEIILAKDEQLRQKGVLLDSAEKELEKRAKRTEELEKKLKAAEEKAKAPESSEEKERLAAEIAELKKQLSMSGAEMTAFKIKFGEWQEAYNAMKLALDCLAPEQREKCEAAIRAVLEGWSND